MFRRLALGLIAAAALAGPALAQPKPLSLKIITSSPGSLNTNFTLISGEKEAVLIDAPFLKSDAHRLVADILDNGKTLTTILVTHAHPDHYFGLAVLHEAFPNAKILAQPEVVEDLWRSWPNRYAFWGPRIGMNVPDHPVMPAAFAEKTLMLEGQAIEVLGPMQGDAANSTVFHVPSLKAIVCGDIVFNQSFPGVGASKAQRTAWIATLDRLAALNPEIVVAGHTKPGAPATRAALDHTRSYLAKFETAVAESKTAEEVVAAMKKAFPEASEQSLSGAAQSALREKQGLTPVSPGAPPASRPNAPPPGPPSGR